MKSEGWQEKLREHYQEKLNESKRELVKELYHKEIKDLAEQAENAFNNKQGSNCIVFTRSKEIASEFLEILQKEVSTKIHNEEINLVTVTINPFMVKTEDQMINQIYESFNKVTRLPGEIKTLTSKELWELILDDTNVALLIIFEELEAYVTESRQALLYKVFDLLHYVSVRLFFVAVAKNIYIVDSFEKRIKSRYSHRQVMLYKVDFKLFVKALDQTFYVDVNKLLVGPEDSDSDSHNEESKHNYNLKEINRFVTLLVCT